MNNKGASAEALNYAIDQQAGDLTLPQITQAAVKALTQDNPNGFFLMVEGGKIDWSSHANDAATTIQEVLDFNESVKIAYDFYLQHPEETLIVITADHETGGYINGNGTERLNLKGLSSQKLSKSALSSQIAALRQSKNEVSWSEVKALLQDNLGLWSQYKISEQVENQLKEVYQKSFINHEQQNAKSLYANDDKIADIAIGELNRLSSISWASGDHSASYAPIYAIGPGSELFTHKMDNTDIPKKIKKAAEL